MPMHQSKHLELELHTFLSIETFKKHLGDR